MADLNVTIGGEGSVQISVAESNFHVALADTEYKVGLAEYGGYGPKGADSTVPGPAGPQGNVGPPGTTSATGINVTVDGTTTDLQTAITQLSQLFFQQASEPVVGVSPGDLWFDTTANVLKVYQDAVWVTVIAQTNLSVASLDAGWF
jgi:hypothetical protein